MEVIVGDLHGKHETSSRSRNTDFFFLELGTRPLIPLPAVFTGSLFQLVSF